MSKPYHRYHSLIQLKCPRCGEGDLFIRKGLLVYRDMVEMPEHCEVCHLHYEMEPGFWIGALWTSYPIVIIIEFPFLMLALFSESVGPWISLSAMFIAFAFAYPVMLRLGRAIWIYNWVRHDPDIKNKTRLSEFQTNDEVHHA